MSGEEHLLIFRGASFVRNSSKAAGWPIYLLLISSIIAGFDHRENAFLTSATNPPPTLLEEVIRVYQNGKVKQEVIDQLAVSSSLGRVLAAGLRNVNTPREVMKESIEEAGSAVAHDPKNI